VAFEEAWRTRYKELRDTHNHDCIQMKGRFGDVTINGHKLSFEVLAGYTDYHDAVLMMACSRIAQQETLNETYRRYRADRRYSPKRGNNLHNQGQ